MALSSKAIRRGLPVLAAAAMAALGSTAMAAGTDVVLDNQGYGPSLTVVNRAYSGSQATGTFTYAGGSTINGPLSGSGGWGGSWYYFATGQADKSGTYIFSGLAPGQYRVSTTWGAHSALASSVALKISNGFLADPIDQKVAPAGSGATFDAAISDGSSNLNFQKLQRSGADQVVEVLDGTLKVTVPGSASNVGLDAIRANLISAFETGIIIVDDDNTYARIGTLASATGSFSKSGSYSTVVSGPTQVSQNDSEQQSTGAASATYTFSNLPSGNYRISARWSEGGTRTTDASYVISDSGGTVHKNQQLASADFLGRWADLATNLSVTDGTLTITVSNSSGSLSADAIRVESVSAVPEPASLAVLALGAVGLGLRRRRG